MEGARTMSVRRKDRSTLDASLVGSSSAVTRWHDAEWTEMSFDSPVGRLDLGVLVLGGGGNCAGGFS